jgi:hypothetical protein
MVIRAIRVISTEMIVGSRARNSGVMAWGIMEPDRKQRLSFTPKAVSQTVRQAI